MFGLQMGFRYQLDGSTTPIPPLSDDVIRHYIPSVEPGCRLPHGWLVQNGQPISMDRGGPIRIIFPDGTILSKVLDAWNWSISEIVVE